MTHDPVPGEHFFAEWLRLIRRRRVWAGAVFLAVFGFSAVVLVLARPVYRAEARLRLGEPPPMSGVSPNAGILSFFQLGGDAFSNDLELFGSRTLAEELVERLALTVELSAPRGIHRAAIFSELGTTRDTEKAVFRVRWADASTVEVRRTAPSDSAIGSFRAGQPASFGGVRLTFRERGPSGPDEVELRTRLFGEALRSTESGLSLTRPRREANVLEVSYAHADPGLAEAVVRLGVERFLAMRTRIMEREAGETVDSLRTVATETLRELAAAEDAVERLQRRTGLVAPDAQSSATIERYEGVVSAFETARAELAALDAQLARVALVEDRVSAWTTLLAHPRFLANQTMGEILTRLTTLQAERTALSAQRAPDSRSVRTLDAQIAELDGALRTVAQEFRGALEGQVADLEDRLAALEASLAGVPRQVLELGRLQRTARVLSELVILTETRLRQEEIRQALTFSNVQVIDEAAVRQRPIWPRTKVGLVVGFILAFGSALLAVVVVERADVAVRRTADVRRLGAGPVLATLVEGAGSKGGMSDEELAALGYALDAATGVLLPVGPGLDAVSVADRLAEAGIELRPVRAASEGFGASVRAVSDGRPVVLLVAAGRTRRTDIARALSDLEAAGGAPVGTVMLVRSDREARTSAD